MHAPRVVPSMEAVAQRGEIGQLGECGRKRGESSAWQARCPTNPAFRGRYSQWRPTAN
jgi:hypothetical protein